MDKNFHLDLTKLKTVFIPVHGEREGYTLRVFPRETTIFKIRNYLLSLFFNFKDNMIPSPLLHSSYFIKAVTEITLQTLLTNTNLSREELLKVFTHLKCRTHTYFTKRFTMHINLLCILFLQA